MRADLLSGINKSLDFILSDSDISVKLLNVDKEKIYIYDKKWKKEEMKMKKQIRLLAVCAIMLCGMIVGGIANPSEIMAKQTIKATREMKDAPKIELDKL